MPTPDIRFCGPNFRALVDIFGREEALALIAEVKNHPQNPTAASDHPEDIAAEYLKMHREGFWDAT